MQTRSATYPSCGANGDFGNVGVARPAEKATMVMLGRDCVKAVFRKQFPPPQIGSKVGFREYAEMGLKWVQKWALTHFDPLLHPKTHF